jgi:hypothetical protein
MVLDCEVILDGRDPEIGTDLLVNADLPDRFGVSRAT